MIRRDSKIPKTQILNLFNKVQINQIKNRKYSELVNKNAEMFSAEGLEPANSISYEIDRANLFYELPDVSGKDNFFLFFHKEDVKSRQWTYKNEKQEIEGPFDPIHMMRLFQKNVITGQTRVCYGNSNIFNRIAKIQNLVLQKLGTSESQPPPNNSSNGTNPPQQPQQQNPPAVTFRRNLVASTQPETQKQQPSEPTSSVIQRNNTAQSELKEAQTGTPFTRAQIQKDSLGTETKDHNSEEITQQQDPQNSEKAEQKKKKKKNKNKNKAAGDQSSSKKAQEEEGQEENEEDEILLDIYSKPKKNNTSQWSKANTQSQSKSKRSKQKQQQYSDWEEEFPEDDQSQSDEEQKQPNGNSRKNYPDEQKPDETDTWLNIDSRGKVNPVSNSKKTQSNLKNQQALKQQEEENRRRLEEQRIEEEKLRNQQLLEQKRREEQEKLKKLKEEDEFFKNIHNPVKQKQGGWNNDMVYTDKRKKAMNINTKEIPKNDDDNFPSLG